MGIFKKIVGFFKKIFGPRNALLQASLMKVSTIWDRETLRNFLLNSADKLKDSLAWRFLSDQEKQLSRCARAFWAQNTTTTNAALDELLNLLNSQVDQPRR